MESIKLTYFDLPARGECIRLLLIYGEKEFDDITYDTDDLDIWRQEKNAYPFGQLPVYEEDGRVTHQTVAILRYLGKKFGLIGENDWENLEIDSMADNFTDFALHVIDYHYEPSAKLKAKKREVILTKVTPFLKVFDDISKESGGYLALKRLTWVDKIVCDELLTQRTNMSNCKLTYFDVPALGEPIRLLLAYIGDEFENVTISMYKWAEYKQLFPFGQVPVYEENGKIVNQSVAIMRYLGKKCGLVGNDDWENLEIDSIGDTIKDLQHKFVCVHFEKSAASQKRLKETFYNETVPYYLERFEKIANENGGHLAIKRLTWVDFYWAGVVTYLSWAFKMDISGNNPNLNMVQRNVLNLRSIKKWYETNPINESYTKEWIEFSGTPTLP
nr:glutathione S-transferase-like [Onthophagus taurus]